MELLRNAHEAACERLEVAAMNFAELPADAPAQVRVLDECLRYREIIKKKKKKKNSFFAKAKKE